MVESYKYKSKIATAIGFLATIIVSLGKDGLTKIIPAEYVWIIPVLVTIASWILAQKTEDHRVVVAEQKAIEDSTNYWNGVKQVIDSHKIAGYQIPDTIIVERDGKKVSVTSNDFFNYLYRTDKDGLTGYARDVKATKPEDALQDEILRAYLKFTGGTYADLVKMAINEEKVKTLRLQSKGRKAAGQMKITPPTNPNTETGKESFGY